MRMTRIVKLILENYESDNPGTKSNIARILMNGKLGGTGRLLILPVDQGYEHGPARSFAPNPEAYDPHYHYKLAIDAGLSAYAAPLGMIEAGANSYVGQIPTILKINSSNSWATSKDQAVHGSVDDALRLGCSAVGFTIYPGSDHQFEMMEELREIALEAKQLGLAVVVWSYPRGGNGFTPGSTSFNNNQSSGGSFRVLINTGDWDNSIATNSPGQSGNPKSKFYNNLYEDWANDIYFPLLYSKSKILKNLENRKVYYPINRN